MKPHNALTHRWIIDDLPREIKQLYLKDCQELRKEIESSDEFRETRMIFVEEGLRGKAENSSKENSAEKNEKPEAKRPLLEARIQDSVLRKNSHSNNKNEKNDESERFERTNGGQPNESNVKVIPDNKNLRHYRRIAARKKKSITLHQLTEKDFFS